MNLVIRFLECIHAPAVHRLVEELDITLCFFDSSWTLRLVVRKPVPSSDARETAFVAATSSAEKASLRCSTMPEQLQMFLCHRIPVYMTYPFLCNGSTTAFLTE
jgi:hypothetical protein